MVQNSPVKKRLIPLLLLFFVTGILRELAATYSICPDCVHNILTIWAVCNDDRVLSFSKLGKPTRGNCIRGGGTSVIREGLPMVKCTVSRFYDSLDPHHGLGPGIRLPRPISRLLNWAAVEH